VLGGGAYLWCQLNPEACKKLKNWCERQIFGGGGGGGGTGGGQKKEKKEGEPCYDVYEEDVACCSSLKLRPCYAQASERLAACYAKKAIPALGYCGR